MSAEESNKWRPLYSRIFPFSQERSSARGVSYNVIFAPNAIERS